MFITRKRHEAVVAELEAAHETRLSQHAAAYDHLLDDYGRVGRQLTTTQAELAPFLALREKQKANLATANATRKADAAAKKAAANG